MADWGCAKRSKTNSGALAAAERLIDYGMADAGDMALHFCQARPLESKTSGRAGEEGRTHYS